jgi:hypothetical protein
VYAIDLLGFGLSDKPIVDYSAELWRDQALAFIEEVVRIYGYMYLFIYIYTHIYIYIHMYLYMHINIHIYIYIYMYTYDIDY